MTTLLFFILGLVALVAGAELLVRGASKLALSFGISPLVVGLTVVAFGTSAPEMAVSVQAALSGQVDIALGNVVGSNIFNVLFILGVSALIIPLLVARQLIRQEVPIMIGASLLLFALARDGGISRYDAALMFGLLLAYTVFLIRQSRRESKALAAESTAETASGKGGWDDHWGVQVLLIAAGLALLVRGARDIAVGNVVGSNTFHLLGVLGLAGMVSPEGLSVAQSLLSFDLPVMIAVAFACLPVFFTGNLIARWEGGVFLGYYAAYTTYLLLAAQQHDALSTFGVAMSTVVLPLTALTLIVVSWRAWRSPTVGKH